MCWEECEGRLGLGVTRGESYEWVGRSEDSRARGRKWTLLPPLWTAPSADEKFITRAKPKASTRHNQIGTVPPKDTGHMNMSMRKLGMWLTLESTSLMIPKYPRQQGKSQLQLNSRATLCVALLHCPFAQPHCFAQQILTLCAQIVRSNV